jgi:hypothetical protein
MLHRASVVLRARPGADDRLRVLLPASASVGITRLRAAS